MLKARVNKIQLWNLNSLGPPSLTIQCSLKVKKIQIKSLLFLSLTLPSLFLLQLFLFSVFLCSVCLTVSSYLHLFSFILFPFFFIASPLFLPFFFSSSPFFLLCGCGFCEFGRGFGGVIDFGCGFFGFWIWWLIGFWPWVCVIHWIVWWFLAVGCTWWQSMAVCWNDNLKLIKWFFVIK